MAHETGHVLGLSHTDDVTRLMFGNGTNNITMNPPILTASEIDTMASSPCVFDL